MHSYYIAAKAIVYSAFPPIDPEPTLEQMLSFSLEKTLYTVNEDNGSLEICVTGELTGDSAQLYFVDGSATMNGIATCSSDY